VFGKTLREKLMDKGKAEKQKEQLPFMPGVAPSPAEMGKKDNPESYPVKATYVPESEESDAFTELLSAIEKEKNSLNSTMAELKILEKEIKAGTIGIDGLVSLMRIARPEEFNGKN
jgi:hypothetical protein